MNSGISNFWRALFAVLLLALSAVAQESPAVSGSPNKPKTDAATSATLPRAPEPFSHRFWDRENAWLFAGIGASRVLDYHSTRNMQSRGREEMLLPDDVANNDAAFATLEAAGAATSIGLSYLLHRTGHHRLERWLSVGHISITTFGAGRNYALKSKHP